MSVVRVVPPVRAPVVGALAVQAAAPPAAKCGTATAFGLFALGGLLGAIGGFIAGRETF